MSRHAIRFEAGFAFASPAMEFPVVPGAHDVFAIESALAERSADVIADARDGRAFPVIAHWRYTGADQRCPANAESSGVSAKWLV